MRWVRRWLERRRQVKVDRWVRSVLDKASRDEEAPTVGEINRRALGRMEAKDRE